MPAGNGPPFDLTAMARTLLITLGFPPAVGGIQRLLHQRCLLQPAQIAVLAPQSPGSDRFDGAQPFPVRRWPAWGESIPGLRRLSQLLRPLLLAHRWQQVQPFSALECGQTLPFGLTAWLLSRRWRIPYDVWAFGDDVLKATRHPLWHIVARFVLRRARRVCVISRATYTIVRALGVEADRIQLIHPWPAACFLDIPTAPLRESATLLTVARLEKRKGIQHLIRLMPTLLTEKPDLRLVIVGDGPYRPSLERLTAALQLQAHIYFTGLLSDAELAEWYRRAALFIFTPDPNRRAGEMEGFGLVCVEAGACGCPVVAWETGGVADAVQDGETGRLILYGETDALRRAILHLLHHSDEATRLGEQGRRRAHRLAEQARMALALPPREGEAS